MSDQERDSFGNLILLCKPHHETIDKIEPESYPVARLEHWKRERETAGQAALQGLKNVTEERLQEMLSEAVKMRDEKLHEAIDRFHDVDSEAADVLRKLIDDYAELRHTTPVVNEDVAGMLNDAAARLAHLEDNAGLLSDVAHKLSHLQDSSSQLSSAANKLRQVEGVIASLNDATASLHDASGIAHDIKRAAAKLEDLR